MKTDVNLTNAIFHDEDAAREHFEKLGWPNGPICPHCGETQKVYRLSGKSHRPGLVHCNACDQAFTIMVGSVMESSHIPLTKWALGFHLMAASKKGVSAKQLQRTLGIGYRAAWFMAPFLGSGRECTMQTFLAQLCFVGYISTVVRRGFLSRR